MSHLLDTKFIHKFLEALWYDINRTVILYSLDTELTYKFWNALWYFILTTYQIDTQVLEGVVVCY
jgi:hypothetical protein